MKNKYTKRATFLKIYARRSQLTFSPSDYFHSAIQTLELTLPCDRLCSETILKAPVIPML